jgi:hypothetical protein
LKIDEQNATCACRAFSMLIEKKKKKRKKRKRNLSDEKKWLE